MKKNKFFNIYQKRKHHKNIGHKVMSLMLCLSLTMSFSGISARKQKWTAYADEIEHSEMDWFAGESKDTATIEDVITVQSEKTKLYLSESYTEEEQKAIDKIADYFSKGETSINISRYHILQDDVPKIMEAAKEQNPMGWAAHKYTSRYEWGYIPSTGETTTIRLLDDYSKEEIQQRYVQLRTKVDEIRQSVPNGLAKDEIVLYIHDYIVYNTAYDIINLRNDSLPADVYSAYGSLINGVAVCQGYSEAMKLLLREYDIPVRIITSMQLNHAWNQVQLNGKWYHVDVTWDDPTMSNNTMISPSEDIYGVCRHQNFLIDDSRAKMTGHIEWDYGFEPCTSTDYMDSLQKVCSRVYYVNGKWYYLYNAGNMNTYNVSLYVTDDIYGTNLTQNKVFGEDSGFDGCLGYYNKNFYMINEMDGGVYTISQDGNGYKNISQEIGSDNPVKELKVSDSGLLTYVYKGSSEEHTYQLSQPEKIIVMDLNEDGMIDSTDAVLLKKYLAGTQNIEVNTKAADINGDTAIDSTDAVL